MSADDLDPNLRMLAEQIPDNIMLLGRDLRIRFINWTVPELTVEQVIGTLPYDYAPPSERERLRELHQSVLDGGPPARLETEFVANDGSVSMWETRASPLMREGQIDGVIVINSNVTERKSATADLTRFFELSPDVLCVATMDGVFTRISRAFTRLLGHEEHDVVGRSFAEFIHPSDLEAASAEVGRLAAGAETTDFEVRFLQKSGGQRTLQWRAIAAPDRGLIYAGGRDVTEQRAIESRLRQSEKMEAIGLMAGGVAHDFNNHLLAILMNTEYTLKHIESATMREHLEQVKHGAQRAAELTRQLLDVSRKTPLRMVDLDLNELIDDLLKLLRRTIPENIELDFVAGHRLPNIYGDLSALEQVVMNLCLNARDALPDGGRISLETETVIVNGRYREIHPWAKPGRYALMTITDDGVGMVPEVSARIFEPFFSTKADAGTGLGLATVYRIVQQHDAMINVYSEPGTGTTFKLYFPVTQRLASTVGDKLDEVASPGGSETLLIAEDADAVRSVVTRALAHAGYHVIPAEDGEQAVALAREHRDEISLALLDLVMPRLGGREAAERIRAELPHIALLFTSGYGNTRSVALDEQKTRVVHKPYELDELLREIRRALESHGRANNQ